MGALVKNKLLECCGSNEEVITAIDGYFPNLPISLFKDGIHSLQKEETAHTNKLVFQVKNTVYLYLALVFYLLDNENLITLF